LAATSRQHTPCRYLDQIFEDNEKEDAISVIALFEAALLHIAQDQEFKNKTNVVFQSDNAGCYNCHLTPRGLRCIAEKLGFNLLRIISNESGDGKTSLDGHFGKCTCAVARQVCTSSASPLPDVGPSRC
jgi:hypothetical protein